MSDDHKQTLPVVPQLELVESRIIEEVLNADDAQPLIVRHLEALEPGQKGSELEQFLLSCWEHLEGVRVIREEGNFDRAAELEESAAAGFQRLGVTELESTSRSLSAYSNAIKEARRMNINRSLELFTSTEDYLKHAGRFGQKFQPIIDHMKPEALFLSVVPALLAGDFGSARVLINQASEMSERVAERYYTKGEPMHFTCLGMAHFYRAFYTYFQAQMDLSQLELDKLAGEDLSASAKEAERLLAQGDLMNIQIQTVHHFSKALIDFLEVTKGIASRMHLCLKATFKPDSQGFLDLRTMTRRAIDNASKAGPLAVTVVRSGDLLLERIRNLERLAAPRKTDFGIFSGIISSVLFLPLLIVALWARKAFGFDLDGTTFFLTIVGLALIGGFGFGALKFKSFLFSRVQSDA